ncbi:MAG: DUF6242 domain-containing protein [Porphyromonadaceae bacterium]|nr:DUF6242 domain-containing protein [Porphyromonadaceae bacterium]
MKYISSLGRWVLAGSLALATLSFVGCGSKSDPKVQDVKFINAQIRSFSISSEKDADLSKIFFSIENLPDTGKIENRKPLAYGKKMEKVKLSIGPANSVAKIYVALANDKYEAWQASKVYDFPEDLHEIKVKVSLEEGQDKIEYIYKVKFNKYKFDPETIAWSGASASPGDRPALAHGSYAYAMKRADDVWVVEARDRENRYYAYRDGTFSREADYTGLPAGVVIRHIEAHDKKPYALASDGRVYRLSGKSWRRIEGIASAEGLLGVLPPRLSAEEAELALLVKVDNGELRFAVYAQGKVKTSSLRVPADFPRDNHRAFSGTKKYIGGYLYLVASEDQGLISRVQRSVWYTTNGLDWSRIYSNSDAGAVHSVSIFKTDDLIYLFETAPAVGLRVWTSEDMGRTWRENGPIAKPKDYATFADKRILAWEDVGSHDIALLGSLDGSGHKPAALWVGVPKKDEF